MKKLIGAAVSVIVIGAGVYFLTKSNDNVSPTQKKIGQNNMQPQVKQLQKKNSQPQQIKKNAQAALPQGQPQTFTEQKVELKKCKSVDNLEAFTTMEDVKDNLLKDAKLDIQKYQQHKIELPSGEIHLVAVLTKFTSDGKEFKELQHFKLDADGLPEPVKVADKDRMNPSQEAIDKILKTGKTIEKQNSSSYMKDGSSISVMMENDKVKELRVERNGKQLNCEQNLDLGLDCKCLN